MRYLPREEDFEPTPSFGSAEPFQKPNHKAKKHGKPARRSEKLGGGFFVFRRHADGRIHPHTSPFEHAGLEQATTEAGRLADAQGGAFEVYERVAAAVVVGGEVASDAIELTGAWVGSPWSLRDGGPFYDDDGRLVGEVAA